MVAKMSEILVIDTSTNAVSVAVGTSTLDSVEESREQKAFHSENILVCIDSVMKKRGITPSGISALGVGVGPGLFTGLRVGISCAHAFAQSLNVPLVYFSSLELTVISSTFDLNLNRGECIVGRDARRNELYAACFELSRVSTNEISIDETRFSSMLERKDAEQLMSPTSFVELCISKPESQIVLDDIEKYEAFNAFPEDVRQRILPAKLNTSLFIDHAIDSVMSSNVADVLAPSALYIRKSDAELSWGTK
jgi:tRNA threonylcarbamoyladenosine biosynthesis protein TsaB